MSTWPCIIENRLKKTLLLSAFAVVAAGMFCVPAAAAVNHDQGGASLMSASEASAFERAVESRLDDKIIAGIAALNVKDGREIFFNADERFLMASTSKTLICAAMLKAGAGGRKAVISKSDLDEYSPVTQHLIGKTLTLDKLCRITLETSDNAAANLALKGIGGPQAVTSFLRGLGDNETSLTRYEPDLTVPDGDKDTVTPAAMLKILKAMFLGEGLASEEKRILRYYMEECTSTGPLLRSVLPQGTVVADRSGLASDGTRGYIGLIGDREAPIVLVIYLKSEVEKLARDKADPLINELGLLALNELGFRD